MPSLTEPKADGDESSEHDDDNLTNRHQHHFPQESGHTFFDSHLHQDTRFPPSIPEGAALGSTAITSTKSPSPPHSSAPTTGTTSTPTSIGNTSSCDGPKGTGPDFPRDSLTVRSPQQQHPHGWSEVSDNYGFQSSERSDLDHPSGRYDPSNYPSALKLLVSNNVAGSIIGRGGQTISELQTQSSTRIKLSQSGDYYPGTQDRVCLVQGETEQVKSALRLLLERLYLLQEHQHSQHMAWQLQRQKGAIIPCFDFVVRVLVPTSSCGMIIGKSGSNIKFMEESTGVASVRLSPKDSSEMVFATGALLPQTSERIVTVTGPNLESCIQCIFLIVDGMASHPDISRYSNMTTSYSKVIQEQFSSVSRPLLLPIPPGSPRHSSPEQQVWDGPFGTEIQQNSLPRRIVSSPDLPGLMMNPSQPTLIPEPQTPERGIPGYSSFPSVNFSPVSGPGTSNPIATQLYLIPQPGPAETGHSQDVRLAFPHSVSAPDLLAVHLERSMQLTSPSPQPQHILSSQDFSSSFIPQAPSMVAPGCFSAQILIPDAMIGSILGRGGRTLNEIQMHSGTRIRISQRGEYMPGTRSRVVTIRGSTAEAVWQSQVMISQRIVLPPTANYPLQPHVDAPTSSNIPAQH